MWWTTVLSVIAGGVVAGTFTLYPGIRADRRAKKVAIRVVANELATNLGALRTLRRATLAVPFERAEVPNVLPCRTWDERMADVALLHREDWDRVTTAYMHLAAIRDLLVYEPPPPGEPYPPDVHDIFVMATESVTKALNTLDKIGGLPGNVAMS